jgi:hypothetical protein
MSITSYSARHVSNAASLITEWAYGNAIVAPIAEAFVRAFIEGTTCTNQSS